MVGEGRELMESALRRYWMYAERPDFLAAMADGEDELERMMGVLRWTCELSSGRLVGHGS